MARKKRIVQNRRRVILGRRRRASAPGAACNPCCDTTTYYLLVPCSDQINPPTDLIVNKETATLIGFSIIRVDGFCYVVSGLTDPTDKTLIETFTSFTSCENCQNIIIYRLLNCSDDLDSGYRLQLTTDQVTDLSDQTVRITIAGNKCTYLDPTPTEISGILLTEGQYSIFDGNCVDCGTVIVYPLFYRLINCSDGEDSGYHLQLSLDQLADLRTKTIRIDIDAGRCTYLDPTPTLDAGGPGSLLNGEQYTAINGSCAACETVTFAYYPFVYCHAPGTETGQAIQLASVDAPTYIGKIFRIADLHGIGFTCAIVSASPVDPAGYVITGPASEPLDSCTKCCSCANNDGTFIDQPTALMVSVSIPCGGDKSVSIPMLGGIIPGGCANYVQDLTDPLTHPVIIDCGDPDGLPTFVEAPILQSNFDPEGLVAPDGGGGLTETDGWCVWWTLVIDVVYPPSYDAYEVILYKKGGQSAIGTYHTLIHNAHFNEAVVS